MRAAFHAVSGLLALLFVGLALAPSAQAQSLNSTPLVGGIVEQVLGQDVLGLGNDPFGLATLPTPTVPEVGANAALVTAPDIVKYLNVRLLVGSSFQEDLVGVPYNGPGALLDTHPFVTDTGGIGLDFVAVSTGINPGPRTVGVGLQEASFNVGVTFQADAPGTGILIRATWEHAFGQAFDFVTSGQPICEFKGLASIVVPAGVPLPEIVFTLGESMLYSEKLRVVGDTSVGLISEDRLLQYQYYVNICNDEVTEFYFANFDGLSQLHITANEDIFIQTREILGNNQLPANMFIRYLKGSAAPPGWNGALFLEASPRGTGATAQGISAEILPGSRVASFPIEGQILQGKSILVQWSNDLIPPYALIGIDFIYETIPGTSRVTVDFPGFDPLTIEMHEDGGGDIHFINPGVITNDEFQRKAFPDWGISLTNLLGLEPDPCNQHLTDAVLWECAIESEMMRWTCPGGVECSLQDPASLLNTVIGLALLPAAVALLAVSILVECVTNPGFELCGPVHDCAGSTDTSACEAVIKCASQALASGDHGLCEPVFDCINNEEGNTCALVWFYVDYAQRCTTYEEDTLCYTVQQAVNDCLNSEEKDGTCYLVWYYYEYAQRCATLNDPGTICNFVKRQVDECLAGTTPECKTVLDLVDDCIGGVQDVQARAESEGACSLAKRIVTDCIAGEDPQGTNVCSAIGILIEQLVACTEFEEGTPCYIAQRLVYDCLDQGEWREDPCQVVWDAYDLAMECTALDPSTPCGQAYQMVLDCTNGDNANCAAVLAIVEDCASGAILPQARAGTNGPCSQVLATLAQCTSGAMSPCDTVVECADDVVECTHYQDYIRDACGGPTVNDCTAEALATVTVLVTTVSELANDLCGGGVQAMSAAEARAEADCIGVVLGTVNTWVAFATRTLNDACGGSTGNCDDEVVALATPLVAAAMAIVENVCSGGVQTQAPMSAAAASPNDCVAEALDSVQPVIATAQRLVADLCPGSAASCVNEYTAVVMGLVNALIGQVPSTPNLRDVIDDVNVPEVPNVPDYVDLDDIEAPDPGAPALLQLLATMVANLTRNLT